MSKADGWEKQSNGWEWRKPSKSFRTEIVKVTGGYPGVPYEWSVYPLPRPKGERWAPLGKGREAKLSIAKGRADAVIREHAANA